MRILLDTCSFLWLSTDPTQLSARAALLLQTPTNSIWLSVVSVWEIITKHRTGKLPLKKDVETLVANQITINNLQLLPLQPRHALHGRTLPLIHHDPFDRLLICQALEDQLTIVTPDRLIRQYAVPTDW